MSADRSAHLAVYKALRSGVLIKPSQCQTCGTTDSSLHGHHYDYSRPLDIEWLCPKCHAQRHREIQSWAKRGSRLLRGKMASGEMYVLRKQLGWTQQRLARALKISVSRLGDYERGRLRGGRSGSAAIPPAIELACKALKEMYDRGELS